MPGRARISHVSLSRRFNNKNSIKELVIPEGVTTIEDQAFRSNELTSVTIKNKQEKVTIGSQAFGTFDINNIVWEPVGE